MARGQTMTCVNCIRSLAALSSKRPGDRWAALSGMERRRFAKVVDGLGRVFLMRNYRASFGKWQTADPLGYPDGWNQLAYFSAMAECGALYTATTFLAGCLCYGAAGASAYCGAVPITLVCLGAGKACFTACGISMTISVGGAFASAIDAKIEGTARIIEHIDNTDRRVFGGEFRREYFE